MTKALTVAEKGRQALRHADRRAIKKATKVIERGYLDATKVNDDGLTNAGTNPFEGEPDAEDRQRIAKDCRQSQRNAPVYLNLALRRVESAEKLDSLVDSGERTPLNIGQVVIVQAAPTYQSIDVTPKKAGE